MRFVPEGLSVKYNKRENCQHSQFFLASLFEVCFDKMRMGRDGMVCGRFRTLDSRLDLRVNQESRELSQERVSFHCPWF